MQPAYIKLIALTVDGRRALPFFIPPAASTHNAGLQPRLAGICDGFLGIAAGLCI
jgi:hypothetical protein